MDGASPEKSAVGKLRRGTIKSAVARGLQRERERERENGGMVEPDGMYIGEREERAGVVVEGRAQG